MAARHWTCRRISGGVRCGQLNPGRKRNCQACGLPRPALRRPKHMAALDLPYEHYVEINGGEHCGICGKDPPPGKRHNRDHDHREGVPRGLLCFRCNAALRPYVTSEWLDLAAAFLEVADSGGHGCSLTYKRGCRCDHCRSTHNATRRRNGRRRRRERLRASRPDDRVYFVQDADGAIKVGRTTVGRLSTRLANLQIGNPRELTLLGTFNGGPVEECELLDAFDRDRIRGEWHRPTAALIETVAALINDVKPA